MTITSVPRLIEMIRESGVLAADQAKELERIQARCADSASLMTELGQRGWLTPYQQEQFLAGKHVDLIVGQYLLLEPLGEGGMAQVFKARHFDTGELAALKVIRKDRWQDSKVVRRFRREIEAVSTLTHPNLVKATSSKEEPSCHFLAMEYVQGINLDRVIANCGPLPIAPACDYVRQVALGLQHIHERGLIHRDIKPGNLLVMPAQGEPGDRQRLGRWGTIKIMDLGFVLLQRQGFEDTQTQLTRKGFLLGTVDYTAPEQAADPHHVDIRADLYSLGCTLFEMLTGKVPFDGSNPFKKLHAHQTEEAPSVESLRAGVPAEVSAIVKKLMAKEPAGRFQKPIDLAQEMFHVIDRLDEKTIPWTWRPTAATRRMQLPHPITEGLASTFLKSLIVTTILAATALAVAHFFSL